MKINPKYGDKIITIPGTQVLEYLKEASGAELRVLIFSLANQSCTLTEIADATGLSRNEVHDALTLWKKKGVMSVTGLGKKAEAPVEKTEKTESAKAESESTDSKKSSKVVIMSSELPVYSTDQINRILEKNKETKALIDNCQQVLGKIMSVHEVEVILKLIDYLNLDADFVLLLCTHCASIKKTSLRYIEKTAVSLFDAGITEYQSLEKYIEHHALAKSREGKMRTLLGIGDRSLTKKEKDAFMNWASLEIPMEVVEKAFEITAENTKRFSISYMNTILERWHKDGLLTVEAIEKSRESYKSQNAPKDKPKEKKGSFDTDDFFEAALKRSYGADYTLDKS
ncbi:MAG: DnaD domain protein [Ruminococcaceae bacterium]|nr:DnaD domain protein [Oscillospiraceae bacterium]